jgi:predicted amidohydrolase
VIGFVDSGVGNQVASGRPVIYNAAAVCANGAIRNVYHKRLLPNYDVFDEERTFEPGSGAHHLFEVGGVKCAVSICEDIWRADGPVQQQARDGAQLNININGSPFHSGKLQEREEMLRTRAAEKSVDKMSWYLMVHQWCLMLLENCSHVPRNSPVV